MKRIKTFAIVDASINLRDIFEVRTPRLLGVQMKLISKRRVLGSIISWVATPSVATIFYKFLTVDMAPLNATCPDELQSHTLY